MRKLFCLLSILVLIFVTGCGSSDVTDQIANVTQADDSHVVGVKNGHPSAYPNISYDNAFGEFFGSPTWKYFVGTKDGPDEDEDGKPDYVEENVDIVEFTGYCTYLDVEVKALIQFTLNDDNTFDATYLSFNEVPQNYFTLVALINKAFESYQEKHGIETSDMMDLYDVRLMSESELISELGYDKNDFSAYPSENDMAICYDTEGNIHITIAGDNKEKYEFCGLKVGNDISSIDSLISSKFTYLGEYSSYDARSLMYRDNKNENGYLTINVSSEIKSISYSITYEDLTDVLEVHADNQVDNDFEDEIISKTPYGKDISGDYEMLIGQSFIYANIQWAYIQGDDYLYISIEGIDETGKEYTIDGYLYESTGKYDCYFCNGNLKFNICISGDNLNISTENDPESYSLEERSIAYLFSGSYYKSYGSAAGGNNNVYCVVAAPDGYVNFRTGPGTGYDIIMPLYNGEELLVTGGEGGNSNWITVVYYDINGNRYEGWVNKTQVKF